MEVISERGPRRVDRRFRQTFKGESSGMPSEPFRVAVSADFYEGNSNFRDAALATFREFARIELFPLSEDRSPITPDQILQANGVIVHAQVVSGETVSKAENLLAIGRFGVGYDAVDVQACTSADVVAFITRGAVDRPVAEATVGWLIALTHHVRVKDQLLREGRWNDRTAYMGVELRDRTLGAVGLGGIARETIRLLSTFGMAPPIAFDPYVAPSEAKKLGVKLVPLRDLMAEADFVSVHCPLNEETRDLIGPAELALMKPGAFLINTARGGIVNEDALYDALKGRGIAGAAIDCFVGEPILSPHRFGAFENVLLAPHSIAWTNELVRDIGRAVCQGMVNLHTGKRPIGVLNPEVFDRKGFQDKWVRLSVGTSREG